MSKQAIDKIMPNYLVIRFGWSVQLVFPYKIGIAILEHFEHAEVMDTGTPRKITPITDEEIRVDLLAQADYATYKANALILPES